MLNVELYKKKSKILHNRKSRKRGLKTSIIILLFLLILFLLSYTHLFVFIIKDNQTLSRHFLLPSEGFSLTYHHSVEKTAVEEIYKLNLSGGFIMDRTIFQSYGAGLPLESKNFSIEGDKFVIDDMNIELEEVRIRVSRTPGQIIKIRQKKYDLQEIGRPGELTTIKSGTLYTIFIESFL
ncbi:MAG: DUF1850 domain-containing protein [Halanaerobiales bacterium]